MNQYYLNILNRNLIKYKNDNVAIYGTGNHTRMLLECMNYTDNIVGLIDKNNIGKYKFGYKIYDIHDIVGKVKAIIISSDVYQELIYERIKYLKAEAIDIIRIYQPDDRILTDWKRLQHKVVINKDNIIAINPFEYWQLDDKIFSENYDGLNKIDINMFSRFKKFMEQTGFQVRTIDKINLHNSKWIVFNNIPKANDVFFHYCIEKNFENLILFMWEPEVVQPQNYDLEFHKYFKYIFTWKDDLVDNKRYFKIWYTKPDNLKPLIKYDFTTRKLCTLIAGNKSSKGKGELYSERKNTIDYFEKKHKEDFEFYGVGWENENHCTYRGAIKSKQEALCKYKFCICYENQTNVQGFITEKILDCLLSGCIPIYWGADNILEYIPQEVFIDRRKFKNNEELYQFIKDIDVEEFNNYMHNIEKFVLSNEFNKFRDEYICKYLCETILNKFS